MKQTFAEELVSEAAPGTVVSMTDSTTFPVQHDTRLFELLTILAQAQAAHDQAKERFFRTVTPYRVDHRGKVYSSLAGSSAHCDVSELPLEALYYQAKTFTRGDEGYWVTTERSYKNSEGEEVTYRTRRPATLQDAINNARINGDDGTAIASHTQASQALSEAEVEVASAHADVVEHEKAYTGWNRYFLVTSSAGHVHRSMHCSTCNRRTTFAPVVSLSGTDDAKALSYLGETLCTVCFPEAPVNGRPSKITKGQATKILKAQA